MNHNNIPQLNSILNCTLTHSKGASNKNEKEEKEKSNDSLSYSKRYSFISSGGKNIQFKTETNKLLFDKSQYSHNSYSSYESNTIYNGHSCHTTSQLSYDCELVLNIKDKRVKLNENELLLNAIILDEEIALAPRLILQDLEGNLLNGKKLIIDAAGLRNSLRIKRDGIVFFGLNRSSIDFNDKESNESSNDYILNISNSKLDLDHLFMIYYYRKTATYFIKSFIKEFSNSTMMLTLKATNPYIINKKTIVIIGNIMMLLDVGTYSFNKDNKKYEDLKIILMSPKEKENNFGMGKNKEYKFNASNCNHVTIGREDCSINLNNNYYSKPHCSIYYNSSRYMWELCDGDSLGNKASTHGTWVLINTELSLGEYNEYIIRLNKQKIHIAKEQE